MTGTDSTTGGGDLHGGMTDGGGSRKRARIGTMDVWKRELGALSTRSFSNRLAASEDLVLHLAVFRELEKHSGSVTTVSFNAAGDALVTASDGKKVTIWDWESGSVKLSYDSEHRKNIFQAKFMPFSEDRSIVTSAGDGQVRHAQILEGGKVESKFLTRHDGRVHKLAIEPGSPHVFYSCGVDGMVKHLDLRTRIATKVFICQALKNREFEPVTHLCAIAIDPGNPNLFAVAGGDSFARLYDIRKCHWNQLYEIDQPVDSFCPAHLHGSNYVGITGLAFSDESELLVSYASDHIYLFSKDMGVGDPDAPRTVSSPRGMEINVAEGPTVFKGHINTQTVKGVNFLGPKCEYVMSGSDCGRIFIWKRKGGELVRVMEADTDVVNSVEAHPHITVLASCGTESNVKIWTPKATERAILPAINFEKVFFPGRNQNLDYDSDYMAYLNQDGFMDDQVMDSDSDEDDGEDEDEDDGGDYPLIPMGDGGDDPFISMDDDGSYSMDGDEDEEEEGEDAEDEEFHSSDRSLDDDDIDNDVDDDDGC